MCRNGDERAEFMASDLYNSIDALSREKGIDPQIVVSAVQDAMVIATRKSLKTPEVLRAELDKETGIIRVFAVKSVVENEDEIEDPHEQIPLEEAREYDAAVTDWERTRYFERI